MIIREKHCVCRCPLKSFYGYPFREVTFDLSRDHCARVLLFSRRGPLRDSTGDRRIGLNMNYSIIFTEISFSPETSLLLQIIQIIHMTFGIIPESDSKGRAVCQFWLQGGKHNVTPTDKLPSGESHPGDLLTLPPPFFWEGRRPLSSPKKHSIKETLTRLGGEDREMSPAATMSPVLCKLSA